MQKQHYLKDVVFNDTRETRLQKTKLVLDHLTKNDRNSIEYRAATLYKILCKKSYLKVLKLVYE